MIHEDLSVLEALRLRATSEMEGYRERKVSLPGTLCQGRQSYISNSEATHLSPPLSPPYTTHKSSVE